MRARLRGVTGTLILVSLLTGCTVGPSTRPALATYGSQAPVVASSAPVSTMPTGAGGPGRTSDPIAWSSCVDAAAPGIPDGRAFTLQCAQVQVPRSYSTASAGHLSVAVAKATANDTPADAPTLVVQWDDPGLSGTVKIAAVAAALPAAVTAHFAVVVKDARGTGASDPIDCISGSSSSSLLSLGADPTTTVAGKIIDDLARTITFDCGDMVGPDLSGYSTVLAADDLDTVRAAIGVPTLNLLGRGFGATLSAVYADRYPGRVARAVLDGPSDPLSTPDKQATAAAVANEKVLDSFVAACPTFDGGCPLGADPKKAITAVISSLGDVGIPTSNNREVTGGSVVLAMMDALPDPSGWPRLAAALAAARSGNTDQIETLLEAALGGDNIQQQQAGVLVYQCNDHSQRFGAATRGPAVDAVRKVAPIFGPYAIGKLGVCAGWPAPETPLTGVKATGAAPILVLGAVDDPVSPYSEVRTVTTQLASAILISAQTGRHGTYPASSCMTVAVNAYLLQGVQPANGTLCPP